MGQNTVRKPLKMLELEAAWGKSFEKKAVELYVECKTFDGVAKAMAISRPTLYLWLRIVDLTRHDLAAAAAERSRSVEAAPSA